MKPLHESLTSPVRAHAPLFLGQVVDVRMAMFGCRFIGPQTLLLYLRYRNQRIYRASKAMKIRNHKGQIDLEEYFERCIDFHGHLAPGLVLGCFMVDWLLEIMEPFRFLNAVVETKKCLPDVVQIMTKCSMGNGRLMILDWGKLAITLYEIHTLEGARVHLDSKKVCRYPLVLAWAMKEKPKKENPLKPLIDEMVMGGRDMLTCQKVIIRTIPEKGPSYSQPRFCSNCGEAFRGGSGSICQGCKNKFFSLI